MNEVIAVTGPMAAGKNYYCSQLEKEGWSCVDADILVHEAIELVKDKILTKFIPFAEQQHLKLTNPDGTIDRKALGKLLFAYPELLNIQESIVYPIIIKQIEEFIGNIIIMTIVIVVSNIFTKTEMNCRTLLIDLICVLVGAGLMTGLQYLIAKKKNDK